MTEEGSRRYTDREVALVLKRASEMEEKREVTPGGGAGLTLAQLEEIARDVGLDPELVARAARELDTRGRARAAGLLGPPATQKSVLAVPGRLDEEGLRALIQVVDGQVSADGLVTEALGTVRWTATDRFHSTQVTVSPVGEETRVQVTERYNARVRPLVHGLPAAWGGMAGVGIGAGIGLVGAPLVAAIGVGAAVGLGIGRLVWLGLSARSGRGVRRLGDALALEAHRLAKPSPEVE